METQLMKSEPRTAPVNGNAEKYRSYREAWARVKQAQEHGFYIEAVTIEESIISDRLTSYLVDAGLVQRQRRLKDYPTFGNLINVWRRWVNGQLNDKLDRSNRDKLALLIDSVDLWRQKRNQIIHAIVKSHPHTPTTEIEGFVKLAEDAASEGMQLAREVCNLGRQLKSIAD